MSAESATLAGRAAEEARQTDTCRITLPGEGLGPWNESAGQYDPPAATTVYEGKCRIPRHGQSLTSGTDSLAGDVAWKVGEYPLNLPVVGSESVVIGATVTYLTSDMDPSLVDRVFTIAEPSRQSQSTARRFKMKEVVGT